MNNQEIALINKNEKISMRTALIEMDLGTAGYSINVTLDMEDMSRSLKITIGTLKSVVQLAAGRDHVEFKRSSGSNDPATYPREWLKAVISKHIQLKLTSFIDDFKQHLSGA